MPTIDFSTEQAAVGDVNRFEALLPTLARGLDVRDIFKQLSIVASRIIPHDEANLAVLTEDGAGVQLFTTTGQSAADGRWLEGSSAIGDADQPRLLDAVPGPERGLRSGLSVPVRVDDRLVAVFALFSRRPQAFSDRDLGHAERLAVYLAVALAHQRLAQDARDAAVERERAANVETSMELLRTIADALDIRTVFSRVSEAANKMLPHDALILNFVDQDG